MSPVVAAAEVVFEFGLEFGRDQGVFEEIAVLAVTVADGQRLRSDVLCDPVRVARAPVVARDEGLARRQVGDGTGKAVLEEA